MLKYFPMGINRVSRLLLLPLLLNSKNHPMYRKQKENINNTTYSIWMVRTIFSCCNPFFMLFRKQVCRSLLSLDLLLPLGSLVSKQFHLSKWDEWIVCMSMNVLFIITTRSFTKEILRRHTTELLRYHCSKVNTCSHWRSAKSICIVVLIYV